MQLRTCLFLGTLLTVSFGPDSYCWSQAGQPQSAPATQSAPEAKGSAEPSEKPSDDAKNRPQQKTDTSSAASEFLRIRRDKQEQPIALETSITRFVGKNQQGAEVTVDLVGAVHVAEHSYYDRLNQLFRSYDAVLYELVAPEGTRIQPGRQRSSSNPVSFLQNIMKNVLKLEFQLDRIDYTKANMVHADMSPQEFSQSMKDRNESFLKMFFQMMNQAMSMQSNQKNPPSDLELLVALVAKDRAYRLKRIMAEQFENMEGQLSGIGGPDGSTIITQRNKKALSVLRDQIDHGKRHLAIFYGAGHLSDMAERLKSEFGFRQVSQQWLVAWKIEPPAAAPQKNASPQAAAGVVNGQ